MTLHRVCLYSLFAFLLIWIVACDKLPETPVHRAANRVEEIVYQWANMESIPSDEKDLDTMEAFYHWSEAKKDFRGMYAAVTARGNYFQLCNDFRGVAESIEDRMSLATVSQDSTLLSLAMYSAAKYYFDKGVFFEALDYFFRLTDYPNLTLEQRAIIYYALGQTYSQIHKNSDSLQNYYYDLAEEVCTHPEFKDPYFIRFILFGRGNIYLKMGESRIFHSDSLTNSQADSIRKAIRFFQEAEASFQKCYYENLCALAISHALLGNFNEAHDFLEKIARLGRPDDYIKGVVFYREKKFGQAIHCGLQGLKTAQEAEAQAISAWNAGLLKYAYQAIGDYRNALHYAELQKEIENKMQESEKKNQMLLNQVKYDTKIKEEQLQKEKSRNAIYRKRLVIISSGTLLLALLLVLYICLYRKKQNAYRELVRKNQQWALQPYEFTSDFSSNVINQETGLENIYQELENGEEDLRLLMQRIYDIIKTEKLYSYKELTVDVLAQELNTNKTYISRAINRITGHNFRAFINEYRVKEAILQISHTTNNEQSFDMIAETCGFNDRITFYRSFKRITGLTPSNFIKNM